MNTVLFAAHVVTAIGFVWLAIDYAVTRAPWLSALFALLAGQSYIALLAGSSGWPPPETLAGLQPWPTILALITAAVMLRLVIGRILARSLDLARWRRRQAALHRLNAQAGDQ